MLQPGDKVAEFSLLNQDGQTVRLSEVLAKGPAVFFFYPKDFTAICTREACGFRDAYADLTGVQVFGVSIDDVATHKRFATEHDLPYSLLADTQRVAAGTFGIVWPLGFRNRRATFVVGSDAKVVLSFQHELSAQGHVDAVRKALAELASR